MYRVHCSFALTAAQIILNNKFNWDIEKSILATCLIKSNDVPGPYECLTQVIVLTVALLVCINESNAVCSFFTTGDEAFWQQNIRILLYF